MNIETVNNGVEVVGQGKTPSRFGIVVASGNAIRRGMALTLRGIQNMPDLEKPIADSGSLPENTNWFASAASMWMWAWRCAEYKWEPLGKGWGAWIRILLSGVLWVGVPVALLYGLLCGGYLLVLKLSDATAKAVLLTGWMMLLCVCLVVLAVLLYVVYAVIMILRGKPIRVPKIQVQDSEANNTEKDYDLGGNETSTYVDDSSDRGSRRCFFDDYVNDNSD